ATGARDRPPLLAPVLQIDVPQWALPIAQAGLFPTGNLQASASTAKDNDPTVDFISQNQASVAGTLTVPVYDGGRTAARVRQAKEILGQTRIWLDRVRARAQSAVTPPSSTLA